MSSRGTTVSMSYSRIVRSVRRRCYRKLRRVRVGGERSKERWGETTATRSNDSSRLYLYRDSVKGIQSRGASVSTRAASRRGKTLAIADQHNDYRQALADNAQLLIMLDLAALVPSVVRWEPPLIDGVGNSPYKTARFVILTYQIRARCITRACQVPDRYASIREISR
jgi:hypothetical protein